MEKIKESLNLTEDILTDLELDRISLEQICLKTLRLARLLNDFDAKKWLLLELNWYNSNNQKDWVDNESFKIWISHWRWNLYYDINSKENIQKIWIYSISELECSIESSKQTMKNINAPESYSPAIASYQTEWYYTWAPLKSEIVHEKYQDVLNKVKDEHNKISVNIKTYQSILSKIKAEIYNYVLEKNYQLKYWNTVYEIFENSRKNTIERIWLISQEMMEILSSIDENLNSANQVDWSNAIHNCRRVLSNIADKLYPPSNKVIDIWGWNKLKLDWEHYIARLKQYIKEKQWSDTFNKIVWSGLEYIWCMIDSIYKSTTKGSHDIVNTKEEAERYVIYTFMLLNDILSL